MILDMTTRVVKKLGKSSAEKNRSSRDRFVCSQRASPANEMDALRSPSSEFKSPSPSSPLHDSHEQLPTITKEDRSHVPFFETLPLKFDPAELYDAYNSSIFDEVFISRFVKLIASSRPYQYPIRPRSWLFELPALLRTYTPAMSAIRYPVRATALAHYAFFQKNDSIQADSLQLYVAGLESQRKLLETCAWDEPRGALSCSKIPDHESICAPLMFVCFELYACTNPEGSLQHLTAAAKLLEIRRPENCATGPEHQMFRSLRILTVCIAIHHT
jgi:hypothetical protein